MPSGSPQSHASQPHGAQARAHAKAPPVCIVWSGYNASATAVMRDGAVTAFADRGGDAPVLGLIEVAGAYELIAACNAAARSGLYRGVCALGCIIKGETEHDRHIASAVAQGLAAIQVETSVPVAFGVLTVNTPEQALTRAGAGDGDRDGVQSNKGEDAMHALLDTLEAADAIAEAAAANTPGLRFYRAATRPTHDKASDQSRDPGSRQTNFNL